MANDPIGAYIARLPEARAERGRLLHALVLKRFPDAVVSLEYRMPTYRVSGHFLAWASRKQHFSLYTCSSERIAAFKQKRPEIKSGVGCLNLRDKDVVSVVEFNRVVRDALAPGQAILAREQAALATARRTRKA